MSNHASRRRALETLVYVAYSKSVEERALQLAKLLDNIEFDADMVSD